jgi:MFS family permease
MKKQILLSASLFHALNDAATVVTPMIFPILYSRRFILSSYAQIGLLSNLGLLVSFVFQFYVVHLSCRYEYRRLMLLSFLGICASMALIPFATSFGALLAFFLLLRLFTTFYHPIIIAWISTSRAGSGQELDDAMGIQSGSGNLGVLLAFLSVGYLAQRWTWTTPLYVWTALAVVLGTLGMLAIRGVSSRSETVPRLSAASWWKSLVGIKRYIPGFFFGGVGWSVVIYYAPSLLNHRFQVPMGATGLYLALWVGLGTVTGYGYGLWSRRLGRRNVFLLSLAGGIVSLFVIGLAGHRALAVAGILTYGGFLLMTYPSLHTFVGSTVPTEGQRLAFSWVSNIQMLSGAVVSLLSGFLSDRFGIQAPFLFTGALSLAIFAFYLTRKPEVFGESRGAAPLAPFPDGAEG